MHFSVYCLSHLHLFHKAFSYCIKKSEVQIGFSVTERLTKNNTILSELSINHHLTRNFIIFTCKPHQDLLKCVFTTIINSHIIIKSKSIQILVRCNVHVVWYRNLLMQPLENIISPKNPNTHSIKNNIFFCAFSSELTDN